MLKLFFSVLLIFASLNAYAQTPTLAIVGDSLATGAVTSPELKFDGTDLWSVFSGVKPLRATSGQIPDNRYFNITEPTPAAPKRLWPDQREYRSFYEWIGVNFLAGVARLFLDTEEYSWGYLVGRQHQVAASEILIAAENGARSDRAIVQMDRILTTTGGVIPRKVYMMFAGNDLCGLTATTITSGEDYGANLERSLQYLVRNGTLNEGGTEIAIAAPLSMLQLVDSPAILAKQVYAHGKTMTCQELQAVQTPLQIPDKEDVFATMLLTNLPASPVAYCRTLFPPKDPAARGEQLAFLSNRLRSYREHGKKMVQKIGPELAKKNINLRWIDWTSALTFQADEIANDCFHLSVLGQAKLAKAVIDGLNSSEQSRAPR